MKFDKKMDPSELPMNLASLQRIDPYISHILMAASRVRLYKFMYTEWEKANIEGSLFVYERKCEPCFGFIILNQLSETNETQPITKDSIELYGTGPASGPTSAAEVKSPFLYYKTKEYNQCIWFSEKDKCQKLFQMIELLINNLRNPDKEVNTGKSLSEALLFAEHGENILCTKIVLNVRNNFCTQHVLPRFELGIFMY